jgi:hypothetical protein
MNDCKNETYLTFSPGLTSVTGTRVELNVGELSTVRVSCSPTRVTFSFFTDTVFSVMVTSASGAEINGKTNKKIVRIIKAKLG